METIARSVSSFKFDDEEIRAESPGVEAKRKEPKTGRGISLRIIRSTTDPNEKLTPTSSPIPSPAQYRRSLGFSMDLMDGMSVTDLSLEDKLLNCLHESLNGDGICTTCGMISDKLYSTGYAFRRTSEKSILPDMEPLSLPDEIKARAEAIFHKLRNVTTKRGNRRKQLVFFCINSAYNEINRESKSASSLIRYQHNVKKLAEMIGIKPAEISKAQSMYSEAQTGYSSPQVFFTADDFLPEYCRDLHLPDEEISEIVRFAREILRRDKNLLEKYPQNVAAGILLYYLTLHGYEFDKESYAKIVSLSEMTITNLAKQISRIHNSSGSGDPILS
jgi:transcription initiation factor TFIIIB Brf1 subunit/transcription initiation factor TFIIB